jgi:uncharacterized membrane protein YfcA
MSTMTYALLLFGALAGGFVSGLAGFGTALMALGIWLYVLPPTLAVPLVLICSVVAQTSTLPSMWKSIDLALVWPFVVGGMAFRFGGRLADGLIGLGGGILGGLAGLSGPLPTLWATVRGWGKDERRGIFQTYNWTVLAAALCLQAGTGQIEQRVIWLAVLAFPMTLLGAWAGTRVYRSLSDTNFRDLVLGLLFLSGAGLVWSSLR